MNTDLATITQEITPLTITDPASLSHTSELRSRAKAHLKALTEEKEKVTKPLMEALKAERSRFKPHEEALESLIGVLDTKMSTYQTNLISAQLQAESRLAERVAKGTLRAETAVAKLDALPTAETKVSTQTGSTTFVATPVFEVTDLALVPLSLHLPDLVQIRKDMLAGIHHNGIIYRIEQRPRNSSK